jgi:RNA polymerase sigma-70 factor (ECF subfamily)
MELSKMESIIQQKLKDSDVSGLEFLFHNYYNDLCRYVMVFTHDEQTAKNIVQDLFISIWENRLNIHFYKSIESYLYQASRLNTLNYIRNQDRREKRNIELGKKIKIDIDGPDSRFELQELEMIIDEE